jgi:hypothetical protein
MDTLKETGCAVFGQVLDSGLLEKIKKYCETDTSGVRARLVTFHAISSPSTVNCNPESEQHC